ncbi:hypothetical protein CDD80_4667 [Ophiocordyceps camponoti-rufipedis]|uniref:Vacuolar ATPase assembly protein VMA22 n=1 Tax=Ophiocordyceps camponoti-rufipedis TaxID=2004952 RepID=A0A2C5YYV9_9HYPO|nr:hypothetical protein CDD80_4667 [Ophiocordyceps camponoti-rufipedis]
MAAQQQQIDSLLQRYLALLDEYTKLRAQLSTLLAGVYQDVARANFSAERGMRYGESHYDQRMRATRRLTVREGDAGEPTFATVPSPEGAEGPGQSRGEDEAEKPKQAACKDPLRWFGLFVPTALRTAQSQSVEAVERVIPRLVSVNAEMLAIEIQVRRARKRRDKILVADSCDPVQADHSGPQHRRDTVEAG